MLPCTPGDGDDFLVCFRKKSNKDFRGKPREIALAQQASGIAGELKHINGKEYWQVKSRIIKASHSAF